MGRKYNVTSTIATHVSVVNRYNFEKHTVEKVKMETLTVLPKEVTPENIKAWHKADERICEVFDSYTLTGLFGMDESTFMKNAKVIPADKRRYFITRTMKGETYTVTYLDITKGGTVENMTTVLDVAIPRSMTDKKESVKIDFVRKQVEDGKCAILSIIPGEGYEILYGMTAVDFMTLGTLLNPETRQPMRDSDGTILYEGYNPETVQDEPKDTANSVQES